MSNLSDITILLLIMHFLGDFQFQNQIISDKKLVDKRYLNRHILIHSSLLIIPLILTILSKNILIGITTIMGIILSHWIIDYLKGKYSNNNKQNELILFLIDQILHISVIIIFTELIFNNQFSNLFIPREYLNWILMIILVTKPANILFKIAFSKYNITDPIDKTTETGAGALIGSLERILSIIFLSMGQISAIGLIYTAKSIARFKQIEENKRFAEYYLIGTLYSILYAIVIFYAVLII